jgi:hypothetical protein
MPIRVPPGRAAPERVGDTGADTVKKALLILLVVLLVLLLVGIGIFLYADSRVKDYAETEAETRIADRVPQASGVNVEIEGYPLLFDVLFSSKIEGLAVTVAKVTSPKIEAVDLSLHVEGIALDRDKMLKDRTLVVTDIERATVQGFLTQEAVSEATRGKVKFSPGSVTATVRGHTFAAKLTVKGRRIELSAPIPGVPPVVVPLPDEELLPCEPEVELQEGRLRLSCTITELPAAVKRAMAQAG